MVAVRAHSLALLVAGVLIAAAALATFVPAVGTLTAAVDADVRGVTVRRLGRSSTYRWSDVVAIRVVERKAKVPDGTEYHWVVPSRSRHLVAVPSLQLVDGRVRELPALAAPADGRRRAAANEHVKRLAHLRALIRAAGESAGEPPLSQVG